jgi:sulfur-oxidizing protein SoxZ
MPDPTLIRARLAGDRTTVRALMSHEMETGQRKDSAGRTVPAWFIQEVRVVHNGKTVLTVMCGPSISKNPYLQFVLKGAKLGDKLGLSWTDSRGEQRSDETEVVADKA